MLFVFAEMQRKRETIMFESPEDWTQEMKRTKAKCRLVTENENFELSQRYLMLLLLMAIKCLIKSYYCFYYMVHFP